MGNAQTTDFLVIGGGIMGLTLAREIRLRHPQKKITVLEKEESLGKHASGRNSGVIHSGIYYPPESLKAKLCVDGAQRLREYCVEKKLPLDPCGKVIVATKKNEENQIELLLKRAQKNGARVEKIDQTQLKELEPEARMATDHGIFAPDTAVIDSKAVLKSLESDLQQTGVEFSKGEELQEIETGVATTKKNRYSFGTLVNAAGAYADRIAHKMGLGHHFEILPFKGLYYRLDPRSEIRIKRLIYPVPDLNVPFLGVHFTRAIDGETYLGPSALPALGRENYSFLGGTQIWEAKAIAFRMAGQYFKNQNRFRNFAHQEIFRFFKPNFAKAAKALAPRVQSKYLLPSTKVGIRAQLFNNETQELVMDFVLEKNEHSLHVLNAVSPGFTCSFAFAKFALDEARI